VATRVALRLHRVSASYTMMRSGHFQAQQFSAKDHRAHEVASYEENTLNLHEFSCIHPGKARFFHDLVQQASPEIAARMIGHGDRSTPTLEDVMASDDLGSRVGKDSFPQAAPLHKTPYLIAARPHRSGFSLPRFPPLIR
jgi:hypothetical protein